MRSIWYTLAMKRVSFLLAIFLLVPLFVHAQNITPDLTINSIPANPAPGEAVRLSVQSYSLALDQSIVSWSYNGVLVATGVGRTSITVAAPQGGATGTITATASLVGYDPVIASLLLRPASVDILWEAVDSYTPPFFKGKALPITNSIIRVTAIPAHTSPKTVSYTWKHNTTNLTNASGVGKSSIIFKNNELDTEDVITSTLTSTGYSAENTITITPRTPTLVGYERNNGFIDYSNGSLTGLSTTQGGIVLHLEPFYFSVPTTIKSGLKFTIDSADSPVPSDIPNEVRLSRPENGGDSVLNITISPVVYALQNLKRVFTVSFY